MNGTHALRAALPLLLTALLLGCGGGEPLPAKSGDGSALPGGAANAAAAPSVPVPDFRQIALTVEPSRPPQDRRLGSAPFAVPAEGGAERTAAASLSVNLPGLPPLPQDGPGRAASAAYTDAVDLGAPAAKSASVQTAAGKSTFVSASKDVAWAYYGLHTYATKASQSATIAGTILTKANGFKSGIFIALANYTTGKWEFFPSVYNLTVASTVNFKPGADYISPGANVYILLASWNGDVVEVSSLTTAGDDSNVPPAATLTVSADLGFDGFNTTLDASGSTDSDLTIVKYEFDNGDGGGFVDNGANPVFPTTINGPGGRLVQVRVTDEGGLTDIATGVVLAVDPASFLPLSWYRARLNAGLGLESMGMEDVFGGGARTFPNFFFEGQTAFSGYFDLRTKLPLYFDGWIGDPESFPSAVDELRSQLNAAPDLQELLLVADGQYWDQHQIAEQTFNPTLAATKPLATALADFVTDAGGTPQLNVYDAAVGSMPDNQQRALARVVLAADSALGRRQAAIDTVGLDAATVQLLFDTAHGDPTGGLLCLNTGSFISQLYDVTTGNFLLAGFPYGDTFFTGAAELTDALDQLRSFVNNVNPAWPDVNLTIDTPAGQIVIAGTGDDTHPAELPDGHALLIDLGGADIYDCHAGGNASGKNGVAVCIDLGTGDDTYNRLDDPLDVDRTQNPSNDNTSQQGGGRMGIGMLVDFGGNDDYQSVRLSQGSAVFGVGLLADLGTGNDEYTLEALGQGGAFAGIGILLDEGGAEVYDAWHKAQGYGGIMGIGVLVDRWSGVDSFTAHADLDPVRPEYSEWFGLDAVNKNLSLCQGAGNGLPLGLLTVGANKLAGGGGLGVLSCGGSGDSYTAGAFAQGGAHFQSCGILLEDGGADHYNAYTYAQGAAANTGLGCLLDDGQADTYFVSSGPGIGAGDGAAIGWLLDIGQNGDDYDSAGTGLGAGISNGFGYFIDYDGDDLYGSHTGGFENTTLGKGNLGTGNTNLPTYGIFVDNDGNDTYDPGYGNMADAAPGPPGNSTTWVRTVEGAYTNGRGSGIDVP